MSNYYKILGLDKTASLSEIKKAYRHLAKKYHPDKNSDAAAEDKFKQASEAYAVLSDPQKKSEYDQFDDRPRMRSTNMNDIFESFGFDGVFDSFFRGSTMNSMQRGRDLLADIAVTFEEAAHGCEKTLIVQDDKYCDSCGATGAAPGAKPINCRACHGSGKVTSRQGFFTVTSSCQTCAGMGKVITEECSMCLGAGIEKSDITIPINIPAGINTGEKLRIPNHGGLGPDGKGDLIIRISVSPHLNFERQGCDIHSTVNLNVAEAALGCQKQVLTLHGEKIVNFPEGTQTGDKLRLKGQGVPNLKKNKKVGSHILHVKLEVPRTLTPEQKEIFKNLKKLL